MGGGLVNDRGVPMKSGLEGGGIAIAIEGNVVLCILPPGTFHPGIFPQGMFPPEKTECFFGF